MGGGSRFGGDVSRARQAIGSQRSSRDAFDYNRRAIAGEVREVNRALNILNKIRECRDSEEHPNSTPIAIAMDVTSSRGDDTLRVYEQLNSMLGSIIVSDIVPDPQILTAAIGDANCDSAPIQVSQFESDERIDKQLGKIWMEKGGGGTGQESYELLAYYLARKTELDCLEHGRKGYLFITGDESPYPTVSPSFVRSYIGDKLKEEIPTPEIFAELQQKYHVFFLFPRTSMDDRVAHIDEEIKQRLDEAGGEYRNCAIRATLVWNDFNDLDLHCQTPGGDHIYYGSKHGTCGGYLDVDRNAGGKETRKPVENIRWKIGDSRARKGTYKFWVNNYANHEGDGKPSPFRVELEVHGKVQTFEGVMPKNSVTKDIPVFEFEFDPEAGNAEVGDVHEPYRDEVILENWGNLIPTDNILRLGDQQNAVEAMLGVIALTEGKFDLDGFVADMESRRVAKKRRTDIVKALEGYAARGVFASVAEEVFS